MPRVPRLRHRLRWHQVELLAAMARTTTLSAAARELNITQPAASRLLGSLSSSLGLTLFHRNGRLLQPTAAGKTLIMRAAAIVAELDRTQDELDAIDDGLVGSVSLGAGLSAFHELVPNALSLQLAVAPNISVSVREGQMPDMVTRLRDGRIDILIGRLGPDVPRDDLEVEILYDAPARIMCGTHHPLARARSIGWEDLLRETWIIPDILDPPLRNALDAVFRQYGVKPPNSYIETSSIQTVIGLLERTNLLAATSIEIALYFSSRGKIHLFDEPLLPPPGPFTMATRRSRQRSSAVARVMDCVRLAAADYSAQHSSQGVTAC